MFVFVLIFTYAIFVWWQIGIFRFLVFKNPNLETFKVVRSYGTINALKVGHTEQSKRVRLLSAKQFAQIEKYSIVVCSEHTCTINGNTLGGGRRLYSDSRFIPGEPR